MNAGPSLAGLAAPEARIGFVFNRSPVMLYWEITRACDLACAHCRAEALPHRHPRELTTLEASGFLWQIVGFGSPLPHVVITGGDPLKRPDLIDVVGEAAGLGLQVSLAPSATGLLTRDALVRLQQAGIAGLSLSLDGSTARLHDRLRGVPGCFDRTLEVARWIGDLELPLQINTLVSAETLFDLPALYDLVQTLRIQRWSLFFLIPVGRGRVLGGITPQQAERLCHWIFTRTRESSFLIAATEAPFYRRVAAERMQRGEVAGRRMGVNPTRRSFGIRDGNGVVFVSHVGDVQPSGFLPVCAGNIRNASVVDLYRRAPVFEALRDVTRFQGKCGYCPFGGICGGSRARAFACTGDYLGSDPLCAYEPSCESAATHGPANAGSLGSSVLS